MAALPTIVFGVFTVIFTLQQDASSRAMREQDQRQADEINRRTMFKDYIDDVRALLLDEDLEYNIEKSLLQIRVQTLTVLKNLDPNRKRDVILFLYENRLLLNGQPPTVDLHGADLNGIKFIKSSTEVCTLPRLYLPGVSAENIVFDGCRLDVAVFDDASMVGATFHSCNLERAHFHHANLRKANFDSNQLHRANFTGAHLVQSSIRGGVFHGVDLTNTDLFQTDIREQLLYSSAVSGLNSNLLVNIRYPNGSFGNIDTQDLIVGGHAQSQVCISAALIYFSMFLSRLFSAISM